MMFPISQAFHGNIIIMYDKTVRITLKDGTERVGLFNDAFYEDSTILLGCEAIRIQDIQK